MYTIAQKRATGVKKFTLVFYLNKYKKLLTTVTNRDKIILTVTNREVIK